MNGNSNASAMLLHRRRRWSLLGGHSALIPCKDSVAIVSSLDRAAPCSTATACGNSSAIASSDSTAPFGLPGKFTMMVCRESQLRRAKESRAEFSFSPRLASARETRESAFANRLVASGVTSRGPNPVPPVVRIKSTPLASASLSSEMLRSLARSSASTAHQTQFPFQLFAAR